VPLLAVVDGTATSVPADGKPLNEVSCSSAQDDGQDDESEDRRPVDDSSIHGY
jgi:hypothetical protein